MTTRGTLPSDIVGIMKAQPLSRRLMMTASAAAAAGYTLAAGPVRADAIQTDMTGIEDGETTIKVAEGDMPIYYARTTRIKKPCVVIVAMEVFGLHEYIRDVTRRIAKLGALAIAPNYYFTKGDLTKISDINQIMPLVNAKADAELIADIDATIKWSEGQNTEPGHVGMIGFCRGGRAVWVYCAESEKIEAAVAFYGSLVDPPAQKALWPRSPLDLASQIKTPVLGLYGADDQGIAVADVQKMKSTLIAAGSPSQIQIFPGVGHGFHADYRPSYNKDAAEKAWQEATDWLESHGLFAEDGGSK